jgi:hypothetical protein
VQWTWDKAQSGQCALELQLEYRALHSSTFWSSQKKRKQKSNNAAAPAKDALPSLLSPHPDDPCAADSSLFLIWFHLSTQDWLDLFDFILQLNKKKAKAKGKKCHAKTKKSKKAGKTREKVSR